MELMMGSVGALAFLTWAFTLFHWVRAVQHRRPEVALQKMLFSGMAAFDARNFTDVGIRHQRLVVRGFAAFFLVLFLGMTLGIAFASQAPPLAP